VYLKSCGLVGIVATFLHLFFFLTLPEASEVILNKESGVELAHRYVMVACRQ